MLEERSTLAPPTRAVPEAAGVYEPGSWSKELLADELGTRAAIDWASKYEADPPARRSGTLIAKRLVDIGVALLLAPVAVVILCVTALLIVIVDRQSPFFIDSRIGRDRRRFDCVKLRTLRSDPALLEFYLSEHPDEARKYAVDRKMENDPRKTPLGCALRKLSLDELPQLLNVLAGDMSIVGPRPLSPPEFEARGELGDSLATVRPGLTGLWQVAGRSHLSHDERVALDDWYARFWSPGLDLAIILRTPAAVFRRNGAV